MHTLFEQIITDFHERELPDLTMRSADMPALPGKIDAIIGMRRTGKTWFLFQSMGRYLDQGIAKESMLYINFDDERLFPLTAQELGGISEAYFRLYPQNRNQRCYFFFDEIQNVVGWEHYLRRLVDNENVQIAVTGSSAKLLSREIATSLRGRSISTEIFPFSFQEALQHEGIATEYHVRPGAKQRTLLENRFRNYLLQGGFPELQSITGEYHTRILQEYVDVVVLRDVVERHQVGNVLPLRYLIRHLLASPATLFSINKFHNDLKSQGIACGKNTLHEYFEYLTDAYLIYPVSIHSRSIRAKQVNPRKVYAIDTGLANAFRHKPQPDWGRLLENLVFMALRRHGWNIEYYRTAKGYEVDFIVSGQHDAPSLYQVTLDISDESTRKREIRALAAAMQETGIATATILTLQDETQIEVDSGKIYVVPVWLWLTALDNQQQSRN